MDRKNIFSLIEEERDRQDKLHPMLKRRKCNDADIDAVTNMLVLNEMIIVLTEEFLEVVRALQGEGDVKEELIQTASVCVRILELLK